MLRCRPCCGGALQSRAAAACRISLTQQRRALPRAHPSALACPRCLLGVLPPSPLPGLLLPRRCRMRCSFPRSKSSRPSRKQRSSATPTTVRRPCARLAPPPRPGVRRSSRPRPVRPVRCTCLCSPAGRWPRASQGLSACLVPACWRVARPCGRPVCWQPRDSRRLFPRPPGRARSALLQPPATRVVLKRRFTKINLSQKIIDNK